MGDQFVEFVASENEKLQAELTACVKELSAQRKKQEDELNHLRALI